MRFLPRWCTRLVLGAAATTCGFSQQELRPLSSEAQANGEISIVALSNPVYPPLARQARISGDVQIKVEVGKDGRLKSASVVSGHQMLAPAALDSVRLTKFECRQCDDEGATQLLIYSFQLATKPSSPAWPCAEHLETQITQSGNHVTVTADPPEIQIYFAYVSVRAAKCLYLWRCGREWGGKDYYFYRVRSAKCLGLWECGYRLREPFATCKKLHDAKASQ